MPFVAFGITSERNRFTRSSVAWAFGAVFGMAVNTAAVPAGSTAAGETVLMSESFATAFSRLVKRVSVEGDSACFFWFASFFCAGSDCFWTCCFACDSA